VLARYFAEGARRAGGDAIQILPEAMQALVGYAWPGNVRELQNAIERAALLADGAEIRAEDLPDAVRPKAAGVAVERGSPLQSLRAAEKSHIASVLAQVDGHRGQAAKILGISERQLYRKIRDHGL
jgi:DNA-binding NtrC family response regulator